MSGRDPIQMNRDELVAYVDAGGDISELLRDAVRGPDLGPAPSPTEIPTVVAGDSPPRSAGGFSRRGASPG